MERRSPAGSSIYAHRYVMILFWVTFSRKKEREATTLLYFEWLLHRHAIL